MALRTPWTSFTSDTQTVANGATVQFPAIALPSIPFLDETSRSPGFDIINVMVAITVPTPAGWTLVADIIYQPVKNAAIGTLRLTPVGLSVLQQIPAAPGMSLRVSCANATGGAEQIAIAYGAAAAPGLTHPDGGTEHQPPTYAESGFGTIDEPAAHARALAGKSLIDRI
jgi:hypothetical protein